MHRFFKVVFLSAALAAPLSAAPVVYWASDPVQPGEVVLVEGEGFGTQPAVSVRRLADRTPRRPHAQAAYDRAGAVPAKVLQPTDTGLKFILPASLKPGQFVFFVRAGQAVTSHTLNQPTIWWWRGEQGVKACPGTELRLQGRNLAMPGRRTTVCLQGPITHLLPATGDGYSTAVDLPATLPPGKYLVSVHNGYGGDRGWSVPVTIEVVRPHPWPSQVFNVRDYGADGSGQQDDTHALQAALDAAGKSGGVVYLPRGRYEVTDTLHIPPHVTLRGEQRKLVALFWPDFQTPPEALLQGTNSFALEDLTIYASNCHNIIVGDLGRTPGAGNVRLERLRVRADAYRGHLTPEEVDRRFRMSLKWSTGGGDTVRLGGENVVITDCDLYGSGRSIYLSQARHSLVANNHFYNGRWGWYCLEGSDGLIFAHNTLQGADLMSTGGGLANYSTACSRNVYYAYNSLSLCHGWDREVMTTDAGGQAYFGKVASVKEAQMTLADDPSWGGRDWTNGGVFILNGKGAGQWRWIKAYQGRQVTVYRPWVTTPDSTSVIGITMFHGHYAFVGNSFTDCGPFQFYGTSVECDVVGNTAARNQGYQDLGLWYHGYQPSWYCQFLHNTIAEGNYYHWTSAGDSLINVYGASHQGYSGPLNRGAVVRGNKLAANSHIQISGRCANVLVAENQVANSDLGIFVSDQCQQVLLRDNKFDHVVQDVADEAALRAAERKRLARFLNRPDPVLALPFDTVTGQTTPDTSGDSFNARLIGGVSIVPGGVTGKAASFDGTGYLQVDEPAVFNAPDLTVDFWVKPATLKGRRGLIVKRLSNSACPFVIGQTGACITFEATDEHGQWSFNFSTPAVLKQGRWSHVTVVMKSGEGVRIWVDGRLAAEKKNALARQDNTQPLILGRDAWGGDPPSTASPGYFIGQLDQVRIWTRALTDAQVAAEQSKGVQP